MLTKCFLKNRHCMPKSKCQKTHAKNQMLKKCKHDLSSNQHTEKVMKYKKQDATERTLRRRGCGTN